MKIQRIIGENIYLRKLVKKYITKKYLGWLNDRETVKYLETGRTPVSMEQLIGFYDTIKRSKKDVLFAVIDKATDSHIGNIKLGNIDMIHRFADLGILIGEKEFQGKGFGSEAIDLTLGYAFDSLNLNKVILGTYADHSSAIKLYKKSGFRIEGKIHNLLFRDGKYHHKIIMGILQSEYSKKYYKSNVNKKK
jgi:RimJ/RimL family protein N-acetyltransferase